MLFCMRAFRATRCSCCEHSDQCIWDRQRKFVCAWRWWLATWDFYLLALNIWGGAKRHELLIAVCVSSDLLKSVQGSVWTSAALAYVCMHAALVVLITSSRFDRRIGFSLELLEIAWNYQLIIVWLNINQVSLCLFVQLRIKFKALEVGSRTIGSWLWKIVSKLVKICIVMQKASHPSLQPPKDKLICNQLSASFAPAILQTGILRDSVWVFAWVLGWRPVLQLVGSCSCCGVCTQSSLILLYCISSFRSQTCAVVLLFFLFLQVWLPLSWSAAPSRPLAVAVLKLPLIRLLPLSVYWATTVQPPCKKLIYMATPPLPRHDVLTHLPDPKWPQQLNHTEISFQSVCTQSFAGSCSAQTDMMSSRFLKLVCIWEARNFAIWRSISCTDIYIFFTRVW